MKVVGTMKPIERISIVDQVINNLKDYIVEQNVAVGDKMPTEKEICEMYGVGRSTAREAYRMMQAIDMIDVKRGKGAYFKGVPSERTDDSCVACWFKEHGQWKEQDYIPNPGDIIFFDWASNGLAGDADHVGIVEKLSLIHI